MDFIKYNLTSIRKLRLTYVLVAGLCSGMTQPPSPIKESILKCKYI